MKPISFSPTQLAVRTTTRLNEATLFQALQKHMIRVSRKPRLINNRKSQSQTNTILNKAAAITRSLVCPELPLFPRFPTTTGIWASNTTQHSQLTELLNKDSEKSTKPLTNFRMMRSEETTMTLDLEIWCRLPSQLLTTFLAIGPSDLKTTISSIFPSEPPNSKNNSIGIGKAASDLHLFHHRPWVPLQ